MFVMVGFQKQMRRLDCFVNCSSKWNRLHCSVDFVLMDDLCSRSAEVRRMASRSWVGPCNIHGSRIDGLRDRKRRIEIVMFVQVGG